MIKVLIADDQKTVREILGGYVKEDPRLEFIGCANNGQEALNLIEVHRPNIVLMDIEMPILDGIAATKIISEQFVDTKVLIISVHNEDSYLNTALQVGAKGYLLKNTPAKELINAIYSAYKGYFQLGPGLLEKYLYKASASYVVIQ
ncbi:MAG: response regulator transcription factor [Pleurocapsa sp.]